MKREWWVSVLAVFVFLCLIGQAGASNQQKPVYSKIAIHLQQPAQVKTLAAAGLIFDHGKMEKQADGTFRLRVVLSPDEIALLQATGFTWDVLIDDLQADYLQRLSEAVYSKSSAAPAGFGHGSMGGYYTFSEVQAELDSMFARYPNLITEKVSIGSTLLGNPMWMVKISDNPTQDEAEPEVLYTALHHAREPGGMMTVIYYMYYLLENYGTDPEVTYLIDNRELYFVPVMNVDGYLYNEQTDPNGGGNWRKNRRDNGGGSYGVDLNRNYGYMWGYDNEGSSPWPASDTYRGTGPFSEPATQVIRDFCESRQFVTAFNYHSYGNLLICPWGYIGDFKTPDSTTYDAYGAEMTKVNGYTYGTGNNTVNYLVNGDSDDWMYGEQSTKNKIFAFTPEVGTDSDGFWPTPDRIDPIAEENLQANLILARVAGGYTIYEDYTLDDLGNGNGYLEAGEQADLRFNLHNIGQGTSANLQLSLSSNDPHVTVLTTQTQNVADLPSGSSILSPAFRIETDAALSAGQEITLQLTLTEEGISSTSAIDGILIGIPQTIFADDAENGISNWDSGLGWAQTPVHHSGSYGFTDSPQGNYDNNQQNALTLKNQITLPTANRVLLQFSSKWSIEADWDFGQVQLSMDGVTWTDLEGKYTHLGAGQGEQASDEYGYDGAQLTWVDEQIDLTGYAGADVYLRFILRTDQGEVRDGWYLDDIQVVSYSDGPSALSSKEGIVPQTLSLSQNYPNPFNPSTMIDFAVPRTGMVQLTLFNPLGQQVRQLVNRVLQPGSYRYRLNADNLPAGIYFYRLHSGNGAIIKKLMLIK